MRTEFLTELQLEAGLSHVLASPKAHGTLVAIFIRSEKNKRLSRQEAYLSPDGGVEGDSWFSSSWLSLADGKPDPRVQVTLMNVRLLNLVAVHKERWSLAGDNLIVDLDLGEENIPLGQRLSVGDVLLEVTEVPHTGCKKFVERYGTEAVKFINAAKHKHLHLRGIYARIVKAGDVRIGNVMRKV